MWGSGATRSALAVSSLWRARQCCNDFLSRMCAGEGRLARQRVSVLLDMQCGWAVSAGAGMQQHVVDVTRVYMRNRQLELH